MALSPEERETVIVWSDADNGVANIDTSQRRVMRKLAKLPKAHLVKRRLDDDGDVTSENWDLPIEEVRRLFRSGKRHLSAANREASRERMRLARLKVSATE